MYRQGDLLIVRADAVPASTKLVASGVVQEGEATGHAHVLEEGTVLDFHGTRFLTSFGEARLVHDEHDTIVLPEGSYRVIRQREYTEDGGWSNVGD